MGLTIEELITMGYYDNPLVVNKSQKWYKKQYKRLRAIHNFSWDGRQKLTQARKGQITKLYNQHYIALGKIERGVYTFVEATKWQKQHLNEQFPSTNKGFIYNHPIEKDIKRTTRIIGKGKTIRLLDSVTTYDPDSKKKIDTKQTFYIPFPSERDRLNHDLFIDYVHHFLKPDFISVAVNGYSGKTEHQHGEAITSGDPLTNLIGKDGEEVYTGIYIIYYLRAKTKKGLTKWLNTINQKISDLSDSELPY
jgi:hypothetical protein